MKTYVIYHRADFDGIFSREIAKLHLPPSTLFIGWDYRDPLPVIPEGAQLYMIDISVEGLMDYPGLVWIDHHKSAMDKYADIRPAPTGLRLDCVAACRLAWQWFTDAIKAQSLKKVDYDAHRVNEPLAVRLVGEHDVFNHSDPRSLVLQHGLRSRPLGGNDWTELLSYAHSHRIVEELLKGGEILLYAASAGNASLIGDAGFDLRFEGLLFLAVNTGRFNSQTFEAGIRPEHDGLIGFAWNGKKRRWRFSMYGVPGKPNIDFAAIATKHGGGGHRQACGFEAETLPFDLLLPDET